MKFKLVTWLSHLKNHLKRKPKTSLFISAFLVFAVYHNITVYFKSIRFLKYQETLIEEASPARATILSEKKWRTRWLFSASSINVVYQLPPGTSLDEVVAFYCSHFLAKKGWYERTIKFKYVVGCGDGVLKIQSHYSLGFCEDRANLYELTISFGDKGELIVKAEAYYRASEHGRCS